MIIRYLDPRGFETILIPNPIDTQKNASKVYFPEKPQPRKKKKTKKKRAPSLRTPQRNKNYRRISTQAPTAQHGLNG